MGFSLVCTQDTLSQTFKVEGDHFLMNGKPYHVHSGSVHYCRIPQEYWKDRLLKARAMGLNTICTYIFWNLHEPQPGRFDFSGNLDVAQYVRTAQEVGVNVIIRPGPYVCSEWDFGGLPSWLLAERGIKVRCADRNYMQAVGRYIGKLGKELAGLQITNGGPIIMVQLENEYGSYGNDKEYLRELKSMLRKAGFDVPLYTSDGGAQYLFESGTLPDVLPVVNFGGEPRGDFKALDAFRKGIPAMCGEYWCGWFTHWGDKAFGRSDVTTDSASVRWMLENDKSFNLYMFDGGTNFGWMAGANFGDRYEPDITSYDYDAPVDEAGRPTHKYYVFRELLSKYQSDPAALPDVPGTPPTIEIPKIELNAVAPLVANLPLPKTIVQPKSMEETGQDYGYILYRTKLIGPKSGRLVVTDIRDYGLVYLNGVFIDTLDRMRGKNSVVLPESGAAEPTLDILVEAMGRVNFGQHLIDRKGITERATLRGITLMNWQVYNLRMDTKFLEGLHYCSSDTSDSPRFFRGTFDLENVGDSFLDLSQWKKGVVWVNGRNLGRFWNIGPQYDLYLPGPWLHRGRNNIVVFDLYLKQAAPLAGVRSAAD